MIVDFHTYVGDWPPYRLPYGDPPGLLRLLDRCAIEVAFVSGLDGLFAYNPGEANAHLAEILAPYRERLRPVGTLNPALPTWRADLADGCGRLRLAGLRLHPAYHGYRLDSPEAAAVSEAVGAAGLPLFVSAFVDEERFQHPALRIPAVPLAQMRALAEAAPATTLVINNLSPDDAAAWLAAGLGGSDVWFDIANMDKEGDGLVRLAARYGTERLLFGSQAPFLYPEAAIALALFGGLEEAQGEAVLSGWWRRSTVLSRVVHGDDL
jgi:uncharacterized protein